LVGKLQLQCGYRCKQKDVLLVQAQFAQVLHTQMVSAQAQPEVQARLPPFQVKTFCIDYMPAAELLNVLAAARLQELSVAELWDNSIDFPPNVPKALAALTSLQMLELLSQHTLTHLDRHLFSTEPVYVEGLADAVQALTFLTTLRIDGNVSALEAGDAQKLPPSLRDLSATFIFGSDGSECVDLSHLTALRSLAWGRVWAAGDEGLQVALPQQLEHLAVQSPLPVLRHAMQKLHVLHVELVNDRDLGGLPQLLSEASPRALQLTFSGAAEGGTELTVAGLKQAVAGIAKCSKLELLTVHTFGIARAINSSANPQQIQGRYRGLLRNVYWIQPLQGLQSLKVLAFSNYMPYVRQDLLLLSSLTALEALSLMDSGSALDGVCCGLLTQSLTGLRQLSLISDGISNVEVIPAVANNLSNLVSLYLEGPGLLQFGDAELLMLTQLIHLRRLGVQSACPVMHFPRRLPGLSMQAKQAFVAAVPGMSPRWDEGCNQKQVFQVPDTS
jgi:hypothetical protein